MNRPMFNALLLGSSLLLGTPLIGCGGGGSAAEPQAAPSAVATVGAAASAAAADSTAATAAAATAANPSVAPSPAEAAQTPVTTLAPATEAAVWTAAQAAESPATASNAGVLASDAAQAIAAAAAASASAADSTSTDTSTTASTTVSTTAGTTASTTNSTTNSATSSSTVATDAATPSASALTVQRSASAAQAGLADSAAAVSLGDIAVEARAPWPFATQQWGNAQCNGTIVASQKLPEPGLQGSSLPGGQTLRFGRVADASTTSGMAFQLTLDASDAITAGSHRCELAFPATAAAGIPRGTVFWHAFAVSIPDWRDSTDEQAIAQWHAGDTSGGLLPVYTLLVRGPVMRLVLRYDSAATPALATAKALVVWSTTNWTPNRWLNFVTQAKVSTDTAASPFVKTWLNGTQIVNYSGPVGYAQPAVQSYAKHGIYHWVDASNAWDMRLPTRTIRLKRPLIAHDASGKYSQAQVRALLNAD